MRKIKTTILGLLAAASISLTSYGSIINGLNVQVEEDRYIDLFAEANGSRSDYSECVSSCMEEHECGDRPDSEAGLILWGTCMGAWGAGCASGCVQ